MARKNKKSRKPVKPRRTEAKVIAANNPNVGTLPKTIPPRLTVPSSSSEAQRKNWIFHFELQYRAKYCLLEQAKLIFAGWRDARVSTQQMLETVKKINWSLDFILFVGNADVLRLVLQQKKKIPILESRCLMEMSVRLPFVHCIGPLVRYGPGVEDRRVIFSQIMFGLLNDPHVDLSYAKKFIIGMRDAKVIDEYTLQFLEDSFEKGRPAVIEILLNSNIHSYVKLAMGDDLLAHLFGNEQVDVLDVLEGRPFDANAKCQDLSALHYATFSHLGRNVRLLLDSGAKSNVKDCAGMTPLFAFGDTECITLLLHYGADVQVIADNGDTIFDTLLDPALLEILLAHTALIAAQGTKIKPEIRKKIASDKGFLNFYKEASKQIEAMSNYCVNDDFSLRVALLNRPENICRLIDHQQLVSKIIDDCCNLPIHPHFVATLETNFSRALLAYGLRSTAVEKLLTIFQRFGIYEMLVEKIVDCLHIKYWLVFV